MRDALKNGILLINTGSPDSPEVPDVRRYLRQFLSDPRVIDIAPLSRWLLVNFVILPRRPRESAEGYASIWTERGSPLIFNSEDFRDGLRERLPDAAIEIGMAYGGHSIPEGIDRLLSQGVDRIVLAPMFPQYASATVGAVLEVSYRTAARKMNVPALSVIPPFYEDTPFLDAWAAIAGPQLDAFCPDHILMSYHGLPERQIFKCDPSGTHCLKRDDCCERYAEGNPMCYRAHCLATTRGIASRLGLSDSDFTVSFQSRLGREPWLTPATDETVAEKARTGVKRLAVLSPAFVADCIETIEEIGMQARDIFLENGGEEFKLVTSLNSEPVWLDAFARIVREALSP